MHRPVGTRWCRSPGLSPSAAGARSRTTYRSSRRWAWAFPTSLWGWNCSSGRGSAAQAARSPSRRRQSRGWRAREPKTPSREYDPFLGRGGLMNEFKKDFQDMQGRFSDRSGHRARDENVYWTPIVVTRCEIEAEAERLASLPRPANGRRESLIVLTLSDASAPGFAPGIQVKLSVLKPGEKSAAFRHNATDVNFCIGGFGPPLGAGKSTPARPCKLGERPSY